MKVLKRREDAGNSVAVIEHNLDVIRSADWVIDLGPEGGSAGGEIKAEGQPEHVAKAPGWLTGKYMSQGNSDPSVGIFCDGAGIPYSPLDNCLVSLYT
ncbi:MAG: hypothetical protein ACXWNQ_04770 [Anaerolineales bacterium]